jgi:ATP-binding cassette, subfamily B, bacterial PglK
MGRSFAFIGRVLLLLDIRERKRLILVALGSIFMALMEVVGVGSIMPFMAVATQPELIRTNAILARVYHVFGFTSDTAFLIFLGVAVLAFLILSNGSQALVSFMKVKFTSMRRHTLSLKLFKGYLGQSYPFFLNRNSYELVKNINIEIEQMITGTLMQAVDLLSRVIQVTLLSAFLFIVNPISMLGISVAIIATYAIIFKMTRKTIKRLGDERFDLNTQRSRVVSEAFWGIKEVKIAGVERVFIDDFVTPSSRLAKNEAMHEIISDLPKFALETTAFSSIIVFVLITIIGTGNFQGAAAVVSLYAYAGYRMIPSVQGIFKALTKLRYGAATAERLLKEFAVAGTSELASKERKERLPFRQTLSIEQLRFTYPDCEAPVIENLSLKIPANSLIGFAGRTGSGKTTLVDIILGLLQPQGGKIVVDGIEVDDAKLSAWQSNLGYVPQNIYLSNDTIAANIAFGVPRAKIDMEAVENAARMAQIHSFITEELPERFESFIGERGVRLSGGQRQRIGIARALYRNPSVLVLDEATSALDIHTEDAVMEAVDSLAGSRTIILIAHRLSTLMKCDVIYLLEKGNIIDSGDYASLIERNQFFR